MLKPEQERRLIALNRRVMQARQHNEANPLQAHEEEWRVLAELAVRDPNPMEFESPEALLASKVAPATEPAAPAPAPATTPTSEPQVTAQEEQEFMSKVGEQLLEEARRQGVYDQITELKKKWSKLYLTLHEGHIIAYRPLLFKDRDCIVESDPPLETQRKVATRCVLLGGDKIFHGEDTPFGTYPAIYEEIMKVSSMAVDMPFPIKA